MTTLPEATYSVTTKYGRKNDLLTVRGATADEFVNNLLALVNHPAVEEALDTLQGLDALANVQSTLGAEVVSTTTAPATEAPKAIEVETDRYGNRFTYNHPDAPDLPDGRGKYIYKEGKSKAGKPYKAWVDPVAGPRPAHKSGNEAPIIWVN